MNNPIIVCKEKIIMFLNRRTFMKQSSLLSCIPAASSSFFARAEESQLKTFYSVDENNNLYVVNFVFPYKKKLLLSVGQTIGQTSVYENFSKILSVKEFTNSDSPYLIILSIENNHLVLHFSTIQITSLEDATLSYVGKLSCEKLDDSNHSILSPYDQVVCPLVPTEQEILENPNLELFIMMFHRYERTFKIISLEKINDEVIFKSHPIQDFQLPYDASIHLLPKDVLNPFDFCFLVMDPLSKQHKYMRLVKNSEDKIYSIENLFTIEDNFYLQNNWVFRFPAKLNEKSLGNKGDQFFFVFQHGVENKKSIIFLRQDYKLAALQFANNKETITPQVVAISKNEYLPHKFHFYAILNHVEKIQDSLQKKEVVLCKNKVTQSCFILSLEKNSDGIYNFTETLIFQENNKNNNNAPLHFQYDKETIHKQIKNNNDENNNDADNQDDGDDDKSMSLKYRCLLLAGVLFIARPIYKAVLSCCEFLYEFSWYKTSDPYSNILILLEPQVEPLIPITISSPSNQITEKENTALMFKELIHTSSVRLADDMNEERIFSILEKNREQSGGNISEELDDFFFKLFCGYISSIKDSLNQEMSSLIQENPSHKQKIQEKFNKITTECLLNRTVQHFNNILKIRFGNDMTFENEKILKDVRTHFL